MTAARMGAGAVKAAQKLTESFPPEVKPVWPGVYRTCYTGGGSGYSKWFGGYWGYQYCDIKSAQSSFGSGTQKKSWRGLAADPSRAAK